MVSLSQPLQSGPLRQTWCMLSHITYTTGAGLAKVSTAQAFPNFFGIIPSYWLIKSKKEKVKTKFSKLP